MRGSVGRLSLFRLAARSFFIQAGWNFERMQGLGFSFALKPGLQRLYPDPLELRRALKRHLEFFNTHPYIAPLVMGAVLRSEKECLVKKTDVARSSVLKQALMGPLAALGDSLFWATLRPLAALASVGLWWLAPDLGQAAPGAAYLIIFNAPHIGLRFAGAFQGYALGEGLAQFLRRLDAQGVVASLRLGAMILLGAVLAGLGRFVAPVPGALPGAGDPLVLFLCAGAMLIALRMRFSAGRVFSLSCLAALIFSLVSQYPR
jgi:mannose/fructose/N-acetylgalactosamine-specific phosphotransferase system component IID